MPQRKPPWVPRPPGQEYLLYNYGVTRADWWDLYRAQGGKCAICPDPNGRKLLVDHSHILENAGFKRGSTRGLLCWIHNSALGAFRDDTEAILAAARYLTDPPAWILWPNERRE
jgi:hypothetical protein